MALDVVHGVKRGTLLVALTLLGCQPGTTLELTPAPATVVTEASFPVVAPAPTAAAALPKLTPCPPGWREDGSDPVVCEPWPDAGMATCAVDSAHFPGETGCARVGTPCPVGSWGDAFPGGRRVRYVLDGAADGGVGTAASPFATLPEALGAAQPGDIVALGRGVYRTLGPLPSGVTVWGACVAQTTLTSAPTSTAAEIVGASTAGVAVRNLLITGPKMGLSAFGSSATLDVQDVIVDAAQTIGWAVEGGAHATGHTVVIRNTKPFADGTDGNGLQVMSGGGVELTRAVFDGNHALGVVGDGAHTRVTLADVAIVNTLAQVSDRRSGRGLSAQRGAVVDLTRGVVERAREDGVLDLDATVHLLDVVVRDTLGREADGTKGEGLSILGGSLTATRVRIDRSLSDGIIARNPTSRVTLADVVVRDTLGTAELGTGAGISVVQGASLTAQRALLTGNHEVALFVGSAGTVASLSDLVVTGTRPDAQDRGGWGFALLGGATATLTRARLEGNTMLGMSVASALQAADVAVRGTVEGSGSSTGLLLHSGAVCSFERLLVEDNAASGMIISDPGTQVTLHDAEVRDSRPDSTEGFDGVGVYVISGAHLTGARVRLAGNRTAGLFASERGSAAVLEETTISDTTVPPCPGHPLCDGLPSTGVLATNGAQVALSRFLVTRNGDLGVALADDGQLDLVDGEISHHAIGANVVSSTFDLGRIDQRVRYQDNALKLGSLRLPLPRMPSVPTGP